MRYFHRHQEGIGLPEPVAITTNLGDKLTREDIKPLIEFVMQVQWGAVEQRLGRGWNGECGESDFRISGTHNRLLAGLQLGCTVGLAAVAGADEHRSSLRGGQ